MKKTIILGLSSSSKLIAQSHDGKTLLQTKFEGFEIANDPTLRPYFNEIIGKQIECSYNKNQKTIKYSNDSFFTTLLRLGALTVNQKELDESKFYTSEQKKMFAEIVVSCESKDQSKSPILLNEKEHSQLLKKLILEGKAVEAQIEYLSDIMLIRFEFEGRTIFLKCKIENCNNYFQLFPQTTFWKDKFLPAKVEVKIVSQKYNLIQKNSQIFVNLPDQTIEHFLKQGWVALNHKTYNKNSRDTYTNLSKIQSETIKKNKGIYSRKNQILSFIYTKDNYVGVVTNVIEAYIYEIMALKTEERSKIQLPMVICPIGNHPGSFQCRQFARKQLIGKEVNVYLHKEGGLNTTGNIVRIEDWKDVESLLLENGYAYLREEFKGNSLGEKCNELQLKAKEKQKGIHKKNIQNRRFEDLAKPPVNKNQMDLYIERRLEILRRLSKVQEIVVQKINGPLNYKIRVESMSILLNIQLEGIDEPDLNPNLKEYREIKQATERFLDRNVFQRTMLASIFDYDEETNQFIGTLSSQNGKVDLQQILIKNSLVCIDRQNLFSKYIQLEKQVKKENKFIWQPKLLGLWSGSETEENIPFEGRFSWVYNGSVGYVQPKNNFDALEILEQKIRKANLPKLQKQKVKNGVWCAAFYEGQLYRAAIRSNWGNQEIVKADSLKQLTEEFLYIPKQCIQVNMNLSREANNKKAIEKLRDTFLNRGIYVFEKVGGIMTTKVAKAAGKKPKFIEKK